MADAKEMPGNVKHQVKMSLLNDAKLHSYVAGKMDENTVDGPTLWQQSGAVVMAVRRPGCRLCRAEAEEISAMMAEIKTNHPSLPLFGVLKEDIGSEIEDFRPFLKGADLYVDPNLSFFKALETKKVSYFSLMTPSFLRIWKRAPTSVGGNLVGEGMRLGAVYVFGPGDQGLVFAHRQNHVGDKADLAQVRTAIELLPKQTMDKN